MTTTRILAAILVLTALAAEADAGARRSRPLKTGQTQCWNDDGVLIACAGTGMDGELRRGEPRAYLVNGDGTIRDQRTALTWEKLSNDSTIHDGDFLFTFDQALGKIDTLNTPPCFAGFCDWRLPNRFELETITNLALTQPAVSAPFNTGCVNGCTVLTCSCTATYYHWSSTAFAGNPQVAWIVDFYDATPFPRFRQLTAHARAVRGGS